MNILPSLKFIKFACLFLLASLILPLKVTAQNIDLTSCGPLFTFTFNEGDTVNESISVLNSTGNVFWEFASTPPGASSTDGFQANFTTSNGLTVDLPAGSPDNAVPETATVTVTGTPTTTGEDFFTVSVADENDGALFCNKNYELRTIRPLDVVLVLDRSGSMNSLTGAGTTRWEALRNAATNFGTMYQAFEGVGPDDRLSITYFETDLDPVSACCNTFVPIYPALGDTIDTDIGANSPGGLTAMGAGLQNAQTKLSDPDRGRAVVLFTDGRQNQNPRVRVDGTGYENPTGSIPSGLKIATIGLGGPNGDYHTTLLNLASQNGGSYNISDDGSAFTFVAGSTVGDLSSGFTDAFITMLSGSSPLIVDRTSTAIPSGTDDVTLQSFPLNRHVDKLLLEFTFDRRFEIPELIQLLGTIQIMKNDSLVNMYARPSWAGNFTNTLYLTINFGALPVAGAAPTTMMVGPMPTEPLESDGDWTVGMGNLANQRIGHIKLTSIADDHALRIRSEFDNPSPRVNEPFPISVNVSWMGHPVEDATVEALIMRPGEDLGDLLARHPLTVDPSGATDAALPGTQKFEELWQNDPDFRNQLMMTENLVTLNHTSDGEYEGVFNSMEVTGTYRILINASGSLPDDAGSYQRTLSESVYSIFGGEVDMAQSGVTADLVSDQQLVMNFRPITDYGRFIGPAMGDAFRISDPDIQISNIEDHQDGSYTITFTGDVGKQVTLELLGQEIYTGRLEDAGKPKSIIDRIRDWLESIGLPGWTIWLLLLLILLILWFIFRKVI